MTDSEIAFSDVTVDLTAAYGLGDTFSEDGLQGATQI